MIKIPHLREKERYFPLFLLSYLVLVYSPLVFKLRTVNPDAQLLLPLFDRFDSIGAYFSALFSLQTFDVQPLRDATLWVDWFVFRHFHLNTMLFQNLVYWVIGCTFLGRILQVIFPSFNMRDRFLSVTLFAVYPLFAATLSWGIARKHVLAFMFIMMATSYCLKKSFTKMNLAYLASILCQPITLLWPFWASLQVFLCDRSNLKFLLKKLIPSFVFFVLITAANVIYYSRSSLFKLYFAKPTQSFSSSDVLLALGSYFYQLSFPYFPIDAYTLGHWSVLVGLGLFIAFVLILMRREKSKIFLGVWGTFMVFPLMIVLRNPQVLSDTYLLVPAAGFFILLLTLIKVRAWVFLVFIVCFSFISNRESSFFQAPLAFAKQRNFDRRPNCDSAFNAALKGFAIEGKIDPQVKQFLTEFGCLKPEFRTPENALSFLYLQTYFLYYENDFPLQQRLETLSKLSEFNYYPRFAKAALYLNSGEDSLALNEINSVVAEADRIQWFGHYDAIVAKVIYPFCQRIQHEGCLKVTERFLKDPDVPWF